MADLLYYRTQKYVFPKDLHLDGGDLQVVFDKLKSHYKFRHTLRLKYSKMRGGRGTCNNWTVMVQGLDGKFSVNTLVHEVAHALQFKKRMYWLKTGKRWHTKEHQSLMNRIGKYAESHMTAWIDAQKDKDKKRVETLNKQYKRQQEQKAYKKTYDYKLKNLLIREKRLLTKIKRLTTIIKKVQKSIKYYEKKG